MAVKELQTRIALKYDSYENWTKDQPEGSLVGKNLVLLKGELGICEVKVTNEQTKDANIIPTVLFKVGDGETPFKDLPWASAKAADVYGWAKKTEAEFKTWLDETAKFATDAEVAAAIAELKEDLEAVDADFETRIKSLEDHIGGDGENGVDAILEDHEERIKILEEVDNATQAELNAYKEEVTGEFDAIDGEINTLNAADAELSGRIDTIYKVDGTTKSGVLADEITRATGAEADLGDRIDGVIVDYQEADAQVKVDLIGGDTDTTQAKTIAGAKAFAAAAVAGLEGGQVSENAAKIAEIEGELNTNIAKVNALVGDDVNKSVRAIAAEETAKIVDGANDKYDTLKEIADFIMSDTTGAAKMVSDIAANKAAIESNDTDIANLSAAVAEKVAITDFNDYKTTVENTYEKKSVVDGINTRLGTAEGTIVTQGQAIANKLEISDFNTFKTGTYDVAIAALQAKDAELAGIVETGNDANSKLRTDITNLQNIVSNGDNTNAKLREAITDLQGIVKTGADANATLRSDLTILQGVVNNATTGLAATKEIADNAAALAAENEERIGAIEGDYLKQADEFIFNCGSSTEVVHVKAAQ